ncbi:DUF202 domain-containing protein [Agromyces sp. SYSU K20354]|uniref:DUF202 domain-containing protein n=1 Tax=Agromyces cavernae TaxID=2898659 RepID=UPI001E5E87CC|nr:DUF202 domain-containing protein [Agromyces cavernae]MCD2442581.1 DUF202 domain-containing protein [Agromyces cavernae]
MTQPPGRPFDPGLQLERTLLAWRRTCLALGLASAVMVRFAAEALGAAAVVLGILGLGAAAAGYARAAVRYRRGHEGLTGSGELPIDGLALALVSVTLVLIGVGALAYVVGSGVDRLLL